MSNKIKVFANDTVFKDSLFTSNPNPIARVSKYMEWDFNPPSNDEDLIVYTDNSLLSARPQSKNNVAWMIESPEYHKTKYQYIKNNHDLFKHVITCDKELLDFNPKFKFAPLGGSWIYDEEFSIPEKSKNFSIMCSWKRETSGHLLRHQIVAACNKNVDIFGSGYGQFLKRKYESLKDYRYSIVVENCKKDYYFTEKIIDCFVTGTIPIYWGCPSIGNFFNLDGVIVFNDLLDLKEQIKKCTETYYLDNLDAVIDNFNRAQKYLLAEDYIMQNNPELLLK